MKFAQICASILSLAILFPLSLCAQSLPNEGFEEWTSSGKPAPFNWEEPTGWKSNNAATEFSTASVRRNESSHSGSSAVSIQTVNIFGDDFAGMLVNGTPTLNFSTYSLDILSGGSPITGRPSNLTGYYRFSSTSAEDAAIAVVVLKKYNSETTAYDIIATGEFHLAQTDEFTQFQVPITYQSTEEADSVVIAFYSTSPQAPLEGGVLIIDDISLSFTSGVEEEGKGRGGVSLFPNPASNLIHINLAEKPAELASISFYDVLGRVVLQKDLREQKTSIEMNLPEGIYLYQITEIDEEAVVGRVVVR